MKHDPLTIFSNAKFETRLAILIDYQSLISNISQDFGVRLLSESEIRQFHQHGPAGLEGQKPSFQISQKATPQKQMNPFLSIYLVNMLTVDMNRRGHKPKALPVSEEKFQFLFGATLQFHNRVYPITVTICTFKAFPTLIFGYFSVFFISGECSQSKRLS